MATEYSRGAEKVVLTTSTPHDQIVSITEKPFEEIRQRLEKQLGRNLRWQPLRNRCFFGVSLAEERGGEMVFPFQPTLTTAEPYEYALRRIIHVPGLRGNPARTYQTTAVGEMFPGTFESYVATIVSEWQEHTPRLMQQLGSDLESLGLTWKVQAKQLNATEVELRVGRLPHPRQGGALDLVSIADVGFGVSQTLPVVVGLLAADEGRMVYLEQPEIHLHPHAQVGLAKLLADAASRGVRVVVETHSALLLLALQSLVAEGRLPSESVLLHWFQRAEDGQTVVISGELDKSGAYGEWPEDFGRVILNAESRYLDAMESPPS
ncbi:MAG TPA: AAA family ATPase [Thermoanaerobaculia bacterium]|nr:AAA family ATPase [Thermoanaerobaculia bacterium]